MSSALNIDVSILPWSYRGSFLSLSTKAGHCGRWSTGNDDVYLTTHCRQWGLPLFALRPLPNGQRLGQPSGFHKSPSTTVIQANPSLLRWQCHGNTVAEATFQNARCLRFRGSVPFAMDSDIAIDEDVCSAYIFTRPPWKGSVPAIDYVFTSMKGYRFVATKGKLTHLNGNQPELRNKRIQIENNDGDSDWELLVCEIDVAPNGQTDTFDTCDPLLTAAKSMSFDETAQQMDAAVHDYTKRLCPWSSDSPTEAERVASYVIWTSTVRADGQLTREAILMSKLWMNKVWSWDNCINALGVMSLDINLALDQIQQLYDFQAPDGRIPDSVDWLIVEWSFTKPPIQGWTLSKLLNEHKNISDQRLLQIYHHTAKFTKFWMIQRRTDTSALPWYSHGNDSGWDNSTVFDTESVIVGPECAAFLILQCDFLANAALKLNLCKRDEQEWITMKQALTNSLVGELWDGESFRVKNALTGETRKSTSLFRLLPLVAAKHLPPEIVEKMTKELSKFLSPWGLATEELNSGLYEADGYWRGPIWAPPTLLIESGLRAAGYDELANTISERFINLCKTGGFAENFDAVTGQGLRDLSYTWTASAFLVLSREAAARAQNEVVLGE